MQSQFYVKTSLSFSGIVHLGNIKQATKEDNCKQAANISRNGMGKQGMVPGLRFPPQTHVSALQSGGLI